MGVYLALAGIATGRVPATPRFDALGQVRSIYGSNQTCSSSFYAFSPHLPDLLVFPMIYLTVPYRTVP